MVADNPGQPIELKTFHARVVDHEALNKQKANCVSIPHVCNMDSRAIELNYKIIKQDIKDIIELVMKEVLSDPEKRA